MSRGPSDPDADRPEVGHGDADQGGLARAHGWVLRKWPTSMRRRVAVVVVVVALTVVVASWLARLVGAAVDLGILAYLGVMAVCWVGAGGALVPIPGVRPLSWVMIVHQSTVLSAPIVVVAAGLAMALGQSSYFLATKVGSHHHDAGRHSRRRHMDGSGRHDADGPVPDPGASATRPSNGVMSEARALLDRGRSAVKRRMAVHPQRVVFLLSVVPNPLTTFATVSAASAGVAYSRFFLASLAGFLVLSTALAIAGQGILVALGIS